MSNMFDEHYGCGEKIAELEQENQRLRELVDAKNQLLVCYRIGKQPTEKLFDKLKRLEKELEK